MLRREGTASPRCQSVNRRRFTGIVGFDRVCKQGGQHRGPHGRHSRSPSLHLGDQRNADSHQSTHRARLGFGRLGQSVGRFMQGRSVKRALRLSTCGPVVQGLIRRLTRFCNLSAHDRKDNTRQHGILAGNRGAHLPHSLGGLSHFVSDTRGTMGCSTGPFAGGAPIGPNLIRSSALGVRSKSIIKNRTSPVASSGINGGLLQGLK